MQHVSAYNDTCAHSNFTQSTHFLLMTGTTTLAKFSFNRALKCLKSLDRICCLYFCNTNTCVSTHAHRMSTSQYRRKVRWKCEVWVQIETHIKL
jgi:hypothetical protein